MAISNNTKQVISSLMDKIFHDEIVQCSNLLQMINMFIEQEGLDQFSVEEKTSLAILIQALDSRISVARASTEYYYTAREIFRRK